MGYPKGGAVYFVNLDPTIGSEIKETQPAVISHNDVSNQCSPANIITAIISSEKQPNRYKLR